MEHYCTHESKRIYVEKRKKICQDLMRCTLQTHANTYALLPSLHAHTGEVGAHCHENCYECLFKHSPLRQHPLSPLTFFFFNFFLQNRHSSVATTVQHNLLNYPTQLKSIILRGDLYFYWARNWKILVRTLDIVFCFGIFFS